MHHKLIVESSQSGSLYHQGDNNDNNNNDNKHDMRYDMKATYEPV